eukprot:TRINITY_DN13420_c0_g1_i1.p1 TRINITY_DN13420_c0_g1~~TRINITY_DN13420_c0_g1_i1.p1  ORF type:complete len:257 (+),score=37.10 TRINITY_DN13420_c0_g1_i1:109-879(+)
MLDLLPNTTYYFSVGNGNDLRSYSSERKFRTGPVSDESYTFATGGDMGATSAVVELNKEIGTREVLFAAVGGDITYSDGFISCYRRWDWWINAWETITTPSGYIIPLIVSIGNHEAGGFGYDKKDAPYFFQYFVHFPMNSTLDPYDLPAYHTHIIGSDSVFLSLDSGVVTPVKGEQSQWLEEELNKYSYMAYKFAIYHVPLYPSIRGYDAAESKALRNAWGPIFDRYHLTIGFENHDHGYKRSHQITNDTEMELGV